MLKEIIYPDGTSKKYGADTKKVDETYEVGVAGTYRFSIVPNVGEAKEIDVNVRFGITYTVAFNANGGTGLMEAQTGFVYGVGKAIEGNQYERQGYTFAGWSKTAEGPVEYANRAVITDLGEEDGGTVTLYAKWTPAKLIFANYQTRRDFSEESQTIEITEAVGGTGKYKYTKKSETTETGIETSYVSITGKNVTVAGGATAGKYICIITAEDEETGAKKDATYTIIIDKIANPVTVTRREGLYYTGEAQELVTTSQARGNVYYSTTTVLTVMNYDEIGLTANAIARTRIQ